jgi:hypothetical protein
MNDPDVSVVGYQASFQLLSAGLFLFNHTVASCCTTLAIPAGDFFDLYEGPVFEQKATGTKECPRYCLNKSEMAICPVQCECSFVREVLQVVMKWPKKNAA